MDYAAYYSGRALARRYRNLSIRTLPDAFFNQSIFWLTIFVWTILCSCDGEGELRRLTILDIGEDDSPEYFTLPHAYPPPTHNVSTNGVTVFRKHYVRPIVTRECLGRQPMTVWKHVIRVEVAHSTSTVTKEPQLGCVKRQSRVAPVGTNQRGCLARRLELGSVISPQEYHVKHFRSNCIRTQTNKSHVSKYFLKS